MSGLPKKAFTDEEFELIKAVLEQNRPEFAKDKEAIRAEIRRLDDQIVEWMAEQPPNFGAAVHICWQGRSFLARYIGEPETSLPELAANDKPREAVSFDARSHKHVAVYAPGEVLARSIDQVIKTCDPQLRVRVYDKTGPIIDDIVDGLIIGVVSVSPHNSQVASLIEHDAKYRSEHRRPKLLPFCHDMPQPLLVPLLLKTIAEMQQGTFHQPVPEKDSLSHPAIVAEMYVPKKQTIVMVVDDDRSMLGAMVSVLKRWQNVVARELCVQGDDMQSTLQIGEPDILLLDEGMPTTGTKIRNHLVASGFQGLIASTTGGSPPSWVEYHFGEKRALLDSRDRIIRFIQFMNALLRRLES